MMTADISNLETEAEVKHSIDDDDDDVLQSLSSSLYRCALYRKLFLHASFIWNVILVFGNVLCVGFKEKHME